MVAESRARTRACGATRIMVPQGVVIPFECNHISPHAAAPAKYRADRRSLSSRGQKRGRCAPASLPWTRFPLQVREVPPVQETLNFCGRSQLRKWKGCRGAGGGEGSLTIRLKFSQERARVHNCEVRKSPMEHTPHKWASRKNSSLRGSTRLVS